MSKNQELKPVSVSIRLDPALAERAKRIAELDRRPLSQVLTFAIESGFDEVERRLAAGLGNKEVAA